MAAGSSLTSQAIQPGSMPYGERAPLEAGLSSAMAGSGAGGAAGAAGPVATGGAPLNPENPLGALASGELNTGMSMPGTDGLSVGPGNGPTQQNAAMMTAPAERLRLIATQAASPRLRMLARMKLKALYRGQV